MPLPSPSTGLVPAEIHVRIWVKPFPFVSLGPGVCDNTGATSVVSGLKGLIQALLKGKRMIPVYKFESYAHHKAGNPHAFLELLPPTPKCSDQCFSLVNF